MPRLFRTRDGDQWKPGQPVLLTLADGTKIKADDTNKTVWGAAPAGARLLFVVEAPAPGKNYQLAKMVTTAASPAQILHFRHERFSLFGTLKPDGTIAKTPPLPPPPQAPSIQGDLF